jgi:hypothetical protein
MGKAKIILIAVIIIVIAIVVVAIIITQPGKQNGTNNTGDNESLKNVEIAKEIYGFSAVIKNIDDKILTLEGSIPAASGEPVKGTVEALVTDQTKIVRLKFPTEIKDKTKPVYPEETVLKLSDLKVGDKVNIASATNISDNVKNGTQFPLTSIFIIEQ